MFSINKEVYDKCIDYIKTDKEIYTFEAFLRANNRFGEVKTQGSNIVLECIFHHDESPSLSIESEKKIFKCFSCERHGNFLWFVTLFKKECLGIDTNVYGVVNEFLQNDPIMQLHVGSTSIYKIAKEPFKEFKFTRNKFKPQNTKIVLDNYLELASKMVSDNHSSFADIKTMILLMQDGMLPQDIYSILWDVKSSENNVSSNELYDINKILGG